MTIAENPLELRKHSNRKRPTMVLVHVEMTFSCFYCGPLTVGTHTRASIYTNTHAHSKIFVEQIDKTSLQLIISLLGSILFVWGHACAFLTLFFLIKNHGPTQKALVTSPNLRSGCSVAKLCLTRFWGLISRSVGTQLVTIRL